MGTQRHRQAAGEGRDSKLTERRPDRRPVQLSLFAQKTVSVSWVAKRWKVSRETVLRRLQCGDIRGYRISFKGWWRVFEESVLAHEAKMRLNFQGEEGQDG
jgi:hypothetical protein